MARFQLAEQNPRRQLGRLVVKAADAAYELNSGEELTDEQTAELNKRFAGDFEALILGKKVKLVFDGGKCVYIVIPSFGGPVKGESDLDSIAEECLGNIVMAGCCQ